MALTLWVELVAILAMPYFRYASMVVNPKMSLDIDYVTAVVQSDLREELHITEAEVNHLREVHVCHAQVAVWLHPEVCRPHIVRPREAWGLWPTQQWMQQVMETTYGEGASVPVQFNMEERRWGRHPQLHRRCAVVQFPSLPWPMLTARAKAASQSRMVWMADCVILAALLAIFSRQEVHIFGLPEDPDRIWTFIREKKAANVYLNDMIENTKGSVFLCPGPCRAVPCCEDHLDLPGDVRAAWDHEHQLYQKENAILGSIP